MIIINNNKWLSVPIDNDYQYQLIMIISWLIVVPIVWPMVWPIVYQLLYNLYDQWYTICWPMVTIVYNVHTFYNSTFYYKVLQITFLYCKITFIKTAFYKLQHDFLQRFTEKFIEANFTTVLDKKLQKKLENKVTICRIL